MGRRQTPVPEGPLHEFAQGLRELRLQAPGAPTYRELARQACFSASALSTAAAGRALPTWEVTRAYVQACGGDVEKWYERWSRLHDELRATHPELVVEQPEEETAGQPEAGPEEHRGTPPPAVPLQRGDPARLGPFRLLGRLGGGSMGRVYLGTSQAGRPVAVKVVRPHLAENAHFRRRFAAEVAAARRVHGLYTPVVVDADPEAALPWMATAYISGPSLADVVAEDGPLPPAVVLGLAAGIAEALAAIHGAGVLHRDLKPANVLLDVDGPKVIDFGVAAAEDASRLTETGARVGTVPFMAPEQADGRPLTGAADVFALGAVLAYAATGVTPFGDGSTGDVLYRVVHSEPDPAALDCGDARLRDLITRCLDKDPERRPTPAQIVGFCAPERPGADWLPTSVAARAAHRRADVGDLMARSVGRRLRMAVGTAAAVLLALVGAAVFTVLQLGGGKPAPRAPYAAAYLDRRVELPSYKFYVNLTLGQTVEGHGGWTLSSNAGGDSKGAFELPDDTDSYISGAASMTADQCAAGLARHPARPVRYDGDWILRFAWVPPGSSFCLRSRKTGDLVVIRVVDTDNGEWGAKLGLDYYERNHA